MTRYIIHIGTPKTGSTTIQAAIVQNIDLLDRQGILYPTTGRHRAAHNNLAQSMNRDPATVGAALATEIAEATKARPDPTVLLSSEMFSLAPPTKLRALLPPLASAPLDIVVYLRRQDLYVESFYKQKAKNGRMRIAFADFVASRQARRITDYEGMLGTWAETFPQARLIPRVFERARFVQGDIVADFATLLQVDPAAIRAAAADHNLSPGRDVIDILLAHAPDLSQARIARLFQQLKAANLPGFAASGDMFDPQARAAFMEEFEQANDRLRARFFPDDDRLFTPPDPARQPPAMTAEQRRRAAEIARALLASDG